MGVPVVIPCFESKRLDMPGEGDGAGVGEGEGEGGEGLQG